MKPTNNTILGPFGDCFRACLASMLDIKSTDLPPPPSTRKSYWFLKHYDRHLRQFYGLRLCIHGDINNPFIGRRVRAIVYEGNSGSIGSHAVVEHNGRVEHDPIPGRPYLRCKEIYRYFIEVMPVTKTRREWTYNELSRLHLVKRTHYQLQYQND